MGLKNSKTLSGNFGSRELTGGFGMVKIPLLHLGLTKAVKHKWLSQRDLRRKLSEGI